MRQGLPSQLRRHELSSVWLRELFFTKRYRESAEAKKLFDAWQASLTSLYPLVFRAQPRKLRLEQPG